MARITLKNKLKIIINVAMTAAAFIYCNSLMATDEDYAVYAKEQEEKAKTLTAPYKEEIVELIKNVQARQKQSDVQSFKSEVRSIANSQCPYLQKDANVIASVMPEANQLSIAVFVSFSMPKESIKAWIDQAGKIGAGVYIRGLVNNSFKDTAKAVSDLVQDNKGGLLIDPTLFKKYVIVQVPAVVLVDKENFDLVYGDVTLDCALEKINKSKGGERRDLLEAIKKVRSGKIRNV